MVLDGQTGQISRNLPSQHTKPIHWLSLPTPSQHAAVSAASYEIFSTSASDGLVMLWDLRSPKCIWRYTGHVNRSEPVVASISPCVRLLACGSEDGCARQIDIRMGRELHRSIPQKDVCCTVTYNPVLPQLVCGSYDGDLRLYTPP